MPDASEDFIPSLVILDLVEVSPLSLNVILHPASLFDKLHEVLVGNDSSELIACSSHDV